MGIHHADLLVLPLLSNKIIEFLVLSETENIQNISTRSDHKS